jgi:hypothetical protein
MVNWPDVNDYAFGRSHNLYSAVLLLNFSDYAQRNHLINVGM